MIREIALRFVGMVIAATALLLALSGLVAWFRWLSQSTGLSDFAMLAVTLVPLLAIMAAIQVALERRKRGDQ